MQNMIKNKTSENEIEKITFDLQARHLEQLEKVSPKGLLFSDFKMQILDLSSRLIEERPTVASELDIKWQQQWDWDLAPAPELSKVYSVRLGVGCRR